MKPNRSGLQDLLYYGEVVGVLMAWGVGVAVVLSGSGVEEPAAEADSYANVSVNEPAADE